MCPDEKAAHETVGRYAAQLGLARVIAVGEVARTIADAAALKGSWRGEASSVPDAEAAIELLRNELRPGDVVLVKASRAASLERVGLAIADDHTGTTEPSATTKDGGDAWASRPS